MVPVLPAPRPRHRGPHRLALHALRRAATTSSSTAPSRPCGARRRRVRPRAASRHRCTHRSWSSAASRPRRATARVRRLPLPGRPLPGPHEPRRHPRRRRKKQHQQHHQKGSILMTTQDAASGGTTTRRRLNLAPVQKFGRSLMLPIAALPAAALLLRLGQPDLLGADGLGWDQRRRRHRRSRQRPLRQPAAAVRRRHRDRHGEQVGRLHGPGGRRRLPRLQGRRRRDVAVDRLPRR